MRDENDRGTGAIFAAGFVGAALCGIELAILLLVSASRMATDNPESLASAVPGLAMTGFIVALIPFLLGVWVVGLPAWMILHRAGWTSRLHSVLAGAVLAPAAGMLLISLSGPEAWIYGAFLLLPGAVAGWTLHRIAYGKAGPPSV